MLELIKKYKSFIAYAIFGVLTTVVNIVVYAVCYEYIGISNVVSNIIAWILAVAFAFVTNKLWVFGSKSTEKNTLIYEIGTFISCRLATGVLDLGIMYVGVDVLGFPSIILKVASNILVIILNYVASKLVIFRKNTE